MSRKRRPPGLVDVRADGSIVLDLNADRRERQLLDRGIARARQVRKHASEGEPVTGGHRKAVSARR